MTEHDLQKAMLAWLLEHGVYAWRVGTARTNRQAGAQRSFRGVSDILGVLPGGRFLAVEVKKPGNGPTEDQLAFLERVRDQGGLAFVAYSVSDLEERIETGEGER